MFRLSNNLLAILNFLTFLLSIPILWAGIWLRIKGTSECDSFLDTPLIVLGGFLLLVSLAGLIGACCRVSWLLWIYLVITFLLIVLILAFTIFAFLVTNKGAGEAVSGKGYKQYRLGDYSHWLQKRVTNAKNWKKVKSCLIDGKVCSHFAHKYWNVSVTEFYAKHLSSIQSGCCKPPDECGFQYENPTTWTSAEANGTNNPDCGAWNNQPDVLCFNCNSCKAGLLQNIKTNWKTVALVNVIFLVFLIAVYLVGCCAFRNSRSDNAYNSAAWKRT